MKKNEPKPAYKGKDTLEANAEKVEEMTYSKTISDEEHERTMKEFSQTALEIEAKEDAFDVLREQHKLSLKPLKQSFTEKLQILKTKQRTVTETVYHIADFENGMMEIFNGDGELIQSRRLTPEEKQLSINSNRHLRVVNEN